jgi:Fe2+ transport system protein FeoA
MVKVIYAGSPMMRKPLSEARAGDIVRLDVPDGVAADVLRELWAMRLLPGEVVTVVAVLGRSGPILVQGAGGVFALGRRLAARLRAEALLA